MCSEYSFTSTINFIWLKSILNSIKSYDELNIDHKIVLSLILYVLTCRKSIPNHWCVHLNGEIWQPKGMIDFDNKVHFKDLTVLQKKYRNIALDFVNLLKLATRKCSHFIGTAYYTVPVQWYQQSFLAESSLQPSGVCPSLETNAAPDRCHGLPCLLWPLSARFFCGWSGKHGWEYSTILFAIVGGIIWRCILLTNIIVHNAMLWV